MVLGSSQLFILRGCLKKKDACFKGGQKRLKNNHPA
jgi:hypothetical protein